MKTTIPEVIVEPYSTSDSPGTDRAGEWCDRIDDIVNPPGAIDWTTGDGVAAAALDQSLDMIVVLDRDGVVVLTNAAWRSGADRHGPAGATTDRGVNYLDVCERSDAASVATGIRAVLAGDLPRFEVDYPCHTSMEDAWYAVEVRPLGKPGAGVVVTHTNITARVAAARRPCTVGPSTRSRCWRPRLPT